MADIATLIERIRATQDCVVQPPAGLPTIESKDVLPDDLRVFYSLCGGMTLFDDPAERPFVRVLPANEVILSNTLSWMNLRRDEYADDPSWFWYTLAEYWPNDYVILDLHPDRAGMCYDGHFETYAMVGDMAIIARSFTEFLERCFAQTGDRHYWMTEGFKPYGYAYEWHELAF